MLAPAKSSVVKGCQDFRDSECQMADFGPFVIAVFGLLFMPGPTNSLLALAGAQVGFVRAWRLAPAQAIAYVVVVTSLRSTIGLVLEHLAWTFRLVASLYLLWLAYKLWHWRPSLSSQELITAREVFVTTMVNPKGLIIAIALIPIDTSAEIPYVTVVALAAVICGIWWIGLGAIVKSNLQPVRKVQFLSRIGSAVMISFAITLHLLHS
jgi:threonine/homoserine/homoserine lactone efflux protein